VPSLVEYKQPGVIPNNLDFNTSKPYLADKRIRQAVSYAIDRSLISEQVMKGLFIPWQTQFGYPWMQPIKDFTEYPFDPEKAKALLEEAGYDTTLELDFLLSEEEPSNDLVVMQQMVGDIGMKWKFRTSLEPANTEDRQQGNFDVQGGGGIGWEADPSAMLPRFGCGLEWPNGGNFTRYCNPAWDGAMKAGASSLDPEQRKPHYWEAANILNEDLPTVFIMLRVNTYFINQRLHNATPQGLAMPNDDGFADWWLE
jgi:peptide/nickel transport system substrate-binding protein